MAQDTANGEDGAAIDPQYKPVYEYDEDAGPSFLTTGEVVDQVPRDDQIAALESIAGEGAVVPDGWFQGCDYASLPVVNGVPITVLERKTPISSKSEGVESSQKYAVDDSLGVVKVQKAFGHPNNTSKIKVNERQTEDN
jgi:hypothetical protein